MRAVQCRRHGHYRDLAVTEVEAPVLEEGGARIAVAAAGVSFATLLVVEGRHQNTPELPFIPGTETAGVVLEVAAGVDRLRPGDRVAAAVRHGGFAGQVVAPADNVWPLPDDMDFAAATWFPTIYGTAYGCLAWRAGLAAGEVLLVHGAAGASGLAAVEIGKALGATVIATAGNAEKLAVAGAHGADHLVDYLKDDFRAAVLELTGGRGADVVFDPVGGEVFARSLRCIAPGGRIIPMGFAGGEVPQIPANILLVKNVTAIGLYWGYYLGWARQRRTPDDIARLHAALERMFAWYREGRLSPLVHATLDLDDFAAAMDLVAARQAVGKVVLTP